MPDAKMPENLPQIGSVWIHLKSGRFYRVTSHLLCCTNGDTDQQIQVVYRPVCGSIPELEFARWVEEFRRKFARVQVDGDEHGR